MQPGAERVGHGHEHRYRTCCGCDLADPDRVKAVSGKRRFENYIFNRRQLAKRAPLVVDHIGVEHMPCGAVEHCFLEKRTIDPAGAKAPVELPLKPGGSIIWPMSVVLTTCTRLTFPVSISTSTSTKVIIMLVSVLSGSKRPAPVIVRSTPIAVFHGSFFSGLRLPKITPSIVSSSAGSVSRSGAANSKSF